MRILIDIGHPAHVHYFKNTIRILTSMGHTFLVVARDKEITFDLLREYNIPYISRGKGGNGLIGKILYIIKADLFLLKQAFYFKPDIFLSFASTYAAHASFLYRRKHITIDDTEHSKFEIFLYKPFTNYILTPLWYKKNLGNKQIRFNSFVEFFHLHKNYFSPDKSILEYLKIKEGEKYVILRFISWEANHDNGVKGLSNNNKSDLISILKNDYKIFISSEKELPQFFEKYRINIPSHKLHDALAFASMYIGEGGTTATESAILGTPNVLINPLAKFVGVHDQLKNKYGVQFYYDNLNEALPKIKEIMNMSASDFKEKSRILNNNSIDLTEALIWLILNSNKKLNDLKNSIEFKNRFS